MTRDNRGNDISNVELPIGSRTIIGPTSRQISVNSLKNADYYPTGSGWYEIGLKVESGGPKWIIDSVAPASNFVSTRTAIAQRDVNVTLNIIGAEYSSIIFKLQTGKSANSKNFSSISQPQKQKQWIVFHEDEYKSGRKRRRVGIATAKVEESRHERGAPLEFEITFDFLPIIVTKLGEGNEVIGGKEVGVIPGGSSVGIDIPGSGMPGSGGGDYASDGGFDINDGTVDTSTPTLPSPGADVGSDKTNEIDIHPDDGDFGGDGEDEVLTDEEKKEKKNNESESVVDKVVPNPKGKLKYITSYTSGVRGKTPLGTNDIMLSSIPVNSVLSVSTIGLFHTYTTTERNIKFIYGIYGSSIDGNPGNLIKEFVYEGSTEGGNYDLSTELDSVYTFNPGLYFLAVKRIHSDNYSTTIDTNYSNPFPITGGKIGYSGITIEASDDKSSLPKKINLEDVVYGSSTPTFYLKLNDTSED